MPSATTATPCACCEVLLAATLECRRRGGTATLCGHSEFISPSTPPKKYRKKTFSGRSDRCNYSSAANCAAGTPKQGSDSFVINALVSEYNSSTCAVVVSGSTTTFQTFGFCPATSLLSTGGDFDPTCSVTAQFTWSCTSPTQKTLTPTAQCAFDGSLYSQISAAITIILSVEDTEADALTRLLAGAGGTWSSWGVAGALGCAQPACCTASYQHRTSGYTVGYQEGQFRVSYSGLAPTTSYNARVYIYRRAYGSSDPWVLYQTLTVTDVTDGSGAFLATGDVPNDAGYESYAAGADIVTY